MLRRKESPLSPSPDYPTASFNGMEIPKPFLAALTVTLFASSAPFVQHSAPTDPPPSGVAHNQVFQEGEELVYEVSWTIFKLGTVRLSSHAGYSAEAQIHSYENVPFVDLHSVHYTEMDSALYSRGSHSVEKKGDEWWGLNYIYDTAGNRLMIEETYQKDLKSTPYRHDMRDTIRMETMDFLDGLSIGYFPRSLIHSEQTVTVPTVLYGKLGMTTFSCTNDKTTESIDADETPIRVVEVDGTTTVHGLFGMNGDFKGWFSDDSAAVPIKGKLKVLLGNVTIELIQWKRAGWNPPH
jgi:hypothetical protein